MMMACVCVTKVVKMAGKMMADVYVLRPAKKGVYPMAVAIFPAPVQMIKAARMIRDVRIMIATVIKYANILMLITITCMINMNPVKNWVHPAV